MQKNFMGIDLPFSDEQKSKIVIYPVAFDKTTTYGHGTNKGPSAIIEASCNLELYDIETDLEVYKNGIFTAEEKKYKSSEDMLNTVKLHNLKYLHKDKFIITIGGEHSISLAPIKAFIEKFGKISIVQFDAHADLVFAYDNNPYSHASVMARIKELSSIDSIVSIGIRSMSIEEKSLMQSSHIVFAHELHENDSWMQKAIDHLQGPVYVTFDLDAFDSSIMPSTGTPEPGGIFWHQALKFLKLLSEQKNIIGFDVMELSPIANFPAPDFLSAKLIYKLLSYIFKNKDKHNDYKHVHEKTFQAL